MTKKCSTCKTTKLIGTYKTKGICAKCSAKPSFAWNKTIQEEYYLPQVEKSFDYISVDYDRTSSKKSNIYPLRELPITEETKIGLIFAHTITNETHTIKDTDHATLKNLILKDDEPIRIRELTGFLKDPKMIEEIYPLYFEKAELYANKAGKNPEHVIDILANNLELWALEFETTESANKATQWMQNNVSEERLKIYHKKIRDPHSFLKKDKKQTL